MILLTGTAKKWFTRKPRVVRLVERPVIFRHPVKEVVLNKTDLYYRSQCVLACRPERKRFLVFGAADAKAAKRAAAEALRGGRPYFWHVDAEATIGGTIVFPFDLVEQRVTEK